MAISGGGLLDPDQASEYLRTWKGRVEQLAADTQTMNERLGQLRVTAEDANRLAQVTIDATGVLVDLQFGPRMQRVDPDTLSRAVFAALGEARQKVAERSRQIAVEAMGPDSVAARTVADRMEEQLHRADQQQAGGGREQRGSRG